MTSRLPAMMLAVTLMINAFLGAATSEKWHLVDVPLLKCNGNNVTLLKIPIHSDGLQHLPHVVTFMRSAMNKVDVKFSLEDRFGKGVVPTTFVALNKVARRLQLDDLTAKPVVDGAESVCEHFFLSDGRLPVELPLTWREARAAFGEICSGEGFDDEACAAAEQRAFEGHPADDTELKLTQGAAEAPLCMRLDKELRVKAEGDSESAFPALPMGAPLRRLKGAGGVGGTTSSGVGYGRSAAGVSRSYPRGYSTTNYGYTGSRAHLASSNMPLRMATTVSIVGSATFIGGSALGGFYSRRSAMSTYKREEGQTEYYYPPEDLARDDLMNLGFSPAMFQYPLTMRIWTVDGPDFEKDRICPPLGYDSNSSNISWKPPSGQDLLVALTATEIMAADGYINTALPRASAGLGVLAGVAVFALALRSLRFACDMPM
eukprot:TRINITY_DN4383_c0_g1_i1.p1 TRINITY_DN4383_c0_g1~~TRINITY_DN4383_c0_g1_i1.p1  ORF type:complete len:431 (-),score=76.68 TRINITY_DN4383_c0_g1_i1:125-1417(-)